MDIKEGEKPIGRDVDDELILAGDGGDMEDMVRGAELGVFFVGEEGEGFETVFLMYSDKSTMHTG